MHIVVIMNEFEERYLRKRGGGVVAETFFCETKSFTFVRQVILPCGDCYPGINTINFDRKESQ